MSSLSREWAVVCDACIFRYGGEELPILFPDQAGADALRATERACRAVREHLLTQS